MGMEIDAIDVECLIPANFLILLLLADLVLLGLPHDIVRCLGLDAEVVDVGVVEREGFMNIHLQ